MADFIEVIVVRENDPDKKPFTVKVPSNKTVKAIKLSKSMPNLGSRINADNEEEVQLIFNGKVLSNSMTLKECKLKNGSKLILKVLERA